MALREGDRYQHSLLPGCIDDYVGEDDPARAYDAFVDALNFDEIGLSIDRDKTGNPAYDPRAMLKLLVYGYSYGVRSSRKLERAVYHNLSFIWLVGGLKPDHKTIARFRKANLSVLKQVLKSCARICLKLNLIEGNVLFVDGSKFRGNCGVGKQLTKARGEKLLQHLDRRIKTLLKQCSAIDQAESDLGSSVSMPKELKDAQRLKQKVETCLDELEQEERSSINRTDKDAILFSGRQGKHAGYNLQAVIDGTQGLVVSTDAVAESNDRKQLLNQVSQAEETLDKTAQTVCADAGYENIEVQRPLMEQGKKVIVPSQQQASGKELKAFDARRFEYDAEKDRYRCPQGKVLRYSSTDRKTLKRTYRIESKLHCLACCHYGNCTRDKKGRGIRRNPYQVEKAQLEAMYQQPESQEIYRQRKLRAELPFGHIKQNLQANHLLIRGLVGAKAEASLLFSVFNISRMINLLGGVKGFRQAMRTLTA